MKIGIIADIHGNIYGLRAVLKKLEGVDKIICAGDIVGYYTFVEEVIKEIREKNIYSIIGNHDAAVLDKISLLKFPQHAQKSLIWTKKNILQQDLDYLSGLSDGFGELMLGGLKIKIFHGSPWDCLSGYIYPNYDNFEKFKEVDADIIALGHTHVAMIKKIYGKIIINPGSCGQSRDTKGYATAAILDTETNDIVFIKEYFDKLKIIKEVEKNNLSIELIKILKK